MKVTTSSISDKTRQKTNSYDQVPYESQPFSASHPDRLATIATLFNLKPSPVNKSRVLELGCASGGNIIPMAYVLPESTFVGIDLSERQVEEGRKTIKKLGLKNIEIKHQNIIDLDKNLGQFDYIIVHGVYSWVPAYVQDKILQVIQDCLAPDGVAYVSYNIFPGWHFRGMIREMMLYHAGQFINPQDRVNQARAFLDFLHQSVPTENTSYSTMLKSELDLIRQQKDSYLLHDHLEEVNSPVYFHEFVEHAARHNLQYVGEAELSTMLMTNCTKEFQETMMRISNDIVRTEQYLDFLRNRSFRQTILCHRNPNINRNLTPQSVMSFYVACVAKPDKEKFDPKSKHGETFSMPDGRNFSTESPLVKAAFHHLYKIWPQNISFEELFTVASGQITTGVPTIDPSSLERDKQTLAEVILQCYTMNLLVLRTRHYSFVTELSEKPKVSELTRHEVEREQSYVTNILHEFTPIDFLASHMLRLMDGTRTKNDILDELVKLAKKGVLVVQNNGQPISDDKTLRQVLEIEVNQRLALTAKAGLLIA